MAFYQKEFKEAISRLPSKEKDKLILRLLKRDIPLANRLLFELVDTQSVEDRRKIVVERIRTSIGRITEQFYRISYLNMDVRYLSGEISEHVSTTKDKYGEVSLNILLLTEVLRQNRENILTARPPIKLYKFCVAVVARVFKILLLINKMDEDLFLDFRDDLVILGRLLVNNDKIMNAAIKNGLDINWLLLPEIPDDIIVIHKELRSNGLLK